MPVMELRTLIHAPIERVFDLARSIDLHVASTAQTGERAVGGVTTGLIGLGQEVTWRARHFGVTQQLTSRITEFNRPEYFRDSMVRGAFKRFDHDHRFVQNAGSTLMTDRFDYTAPFGLLGLLADRLFLQRHMERLLEARNRVVKEAAESDSWRRYLPVK